MADAVRASRLIMVAEVRPVAGAAVEAEGAVRVRRGATGLVSAGAGGAERSEAPSVRGAAVDDVTVAGRRRLEWSAARGRGSVPCDVEDPTDEARDGTVRFESSSATSETAAGSSLTAERVEGGFLATLVGTPDAGFGRADRAVGASRRREPVAVEPGITEVRVDLLGPAEGGGMEPPPTVRWLAESDVSLLSCR